MRSRSYLFLLLVLGLAGLSSFLYNVRPYNYGLDVRGGVRFVYQIKESDLTGDKAKNLDEIRRKVVMVLERRVASNLGVVEGVVAPKGDKQFIVELPGFTKPEEAAKVMGQSASLKFYHAKNVVTERSQFRPYQSFDGSSDGESPEIWFQRTGSTEPIKPGTPEYLNVIKGWGEPLLEGDDLLRAQPSGSGSKVIPELFFSAKGASKMERWTRSTMSMRERLAAVLDDVVLSCVPVQDNTILRDEAVITGDFKPGYVTAFCNLLNSGALPVSIEVQSSEAVDPTIGKSALNQMVTAGLISFAIIALFLLAYYAFPGFIALIALTLYVLFTITVLKLIGATFSLAAIAGFILSVGMAVDANILVFERFKEEMKHGRSLHSSIELGFKRALPAIVDSNACTILTSLVLAGLGTGPVKGFATTLIIGVAISLFTAITVTRSLLMFFVDSGIGSNPRWYAVDRNWFGNVEERANERPLRVVENTKKWFLISLATIVVFLPFVFLGGFKLNVEFRGGYETGLSLARVNKSREEIASSLKAAGIEGANVKFIGSGTNRIASVSVPLSYGQAGESANKVAERVAKAAGFSGADVRSPSYVGPTIQAETYLNAIKGVLFSAALIVVYLAFRFGFAVGNFALGLRFGMSAILALLHDILVVFGVTAFAGWLEGWEISSLFITSMLTVIGFSVHDTIVIFDRIRENLRKPLPGEDFAHLVNRSVTQSFSRSINTSMTVVVTLIILFSIGSATADLKLFCVTMLAGILSGTYSSIFNAAPILYLWDRSVAKKKGEDQTLVAAAKREMAAEKIITSAKPVEAPAVTSNTTGRSYGQVRRRASSPSKKIEIEEP